MKLKRVGQISLQCDDHRIGPASVQPEKYPLQHVCQRFQPQVRL
jgi:hypothetical protein